MWRMVQNSITKARIYCRDLRREYAIESYWQRSSQISEMRHAHFKKLNALDVTFCTDNLISSNWLLFSTVRTQIRFIGIHREKTTIGHSIIDRRAKWVCCTSEMNVTCMIRLHREKCAMKSAVLLFDRIHYTGIGHPNHVQFSSLLRQWQHQSVNTRRRCVLPFSRINPSIRQRRRRKAIAASSWTLKVPLALRLRQIPVTPTRRVPPFIFNNFSYHAFIIFFLFLFIILIILVISFYKSSLLASIQCTGSSFWWSGWSSRSKKLLKTFHESTMLSEFRYYKYVPSSAVTISAYAFLLSHK